MSNQITADIRAIGGAEVAQALDGVKRGVANRVVKGALMKIARVGLKSAKANLRRTRSGQLRKSLGIRPKSYKGGAVHIVVIGARRGFRTTGEDGKNIDPTKYSHLLERGRKAVTPKAGKALVFLGRGQVTRGTGGRFVRQQGQKIIVRRVREFAGDPFLEPALPAIKAASDARLVADIREGVAREAVKYAGRGKSIYKG